MQKLSIFQLLILSLLFQSCSNTSEGALISSTAGNYFQKTKLISNNEATAGIFKVRRTYEQTIDGFGAVFNELGYDACQMLSKENRDAIMREFYSEDGLNFSICRVPIGANDYARSWYSLDDTPGDFAMKDFNIDRDKTTLIPYINEALRIRPDMKIWASPWCPPAWMKVNNHYACRPAGVNDLSPDKTGKENHTQFIMEEKYLEAYALYFAKFIETYQDEGIAIYAVHVQNEPNSCQNFPSCIWTAKALNIFIGQYLGPMFEKRGLDAEIWLGTIERPYVEKVDTVLSDQDSKKYVKGVGFQWAGKKCISGVHEKYPAMKLMQTESECGNGTNDWSAAEYTWSLMKHYMENGANAYMYWNTILDETGSSMWGWKQNSLVSVHSQTGEINRHPEYYLMKHLSHYVKPGAHRLVTPEGFNFGLLFENPDGKIVGLLVNTNDEDHEICIEADNNIYTFKLNAHSMNTLII